MEWQRITSMMFSSVSQANRRHFSIDSSKSDSPLMWYCVQYRTTLRHHWNASAVRLILSPCSLPRVKRRIFSNISARLPIFNNVGGLLTRTRVFKDATLCNNRHVRINHPQEMNPRYRVKAPADPNNPRATKLVDIPAGVCVFCQNRFFVVVIS